MLFRSFVRRCPFLDAAEGLSCGRWAFLLFSIVACSSSETTTVPGSQDDGSSQNDGAASSTDEAPTRSETLPHPGASRAPAGLSPRSQCKRGVAYGSHSLQDLQALSKGVSWWYNWAFLPDAALSEGQHRDLAVEYVPMIWGAGSDTEGARLAITEDATTLLGFNEPNFGEQANISAEDAAALWPEVEAVADAHQLYLVSPAVNFCGGDCRDTDPFRYLDEFFASCPDCRVDAIGIHIYVGCNPGGANHAEWLIQHVETYKERFDLPLWLTEFACDSASSMAEQQAFLQDAVAYLEGEPRIERYAWFAGRADNVPFVDLLGADGELTALGRAYVDAPAPEECQR